MNDSAAHGGLFTVLKDIAATLLASGRTRLELLGNEIEEEKLRAIQLLLIAQFMAFCLALGIVLAIGLLMLLLWDHHFVVLGASSLAFLALGGYFYGVFRRTAQRPERVFAASIAELQEDLRQLKEAAGNAAPDR